MRLGFRPIANAPAAPTKPKPAHNPDGTPSKPSSPPARREAPTPTRREAPDHCPGNLPSGPCRIN